MGGSRPTFGYLDSVITSQLIPTMAPMKAMKAAAAMSKGALADALATKCELKKAVAGKVMAILAEIATAEVKKTGVFTIPGLCRIKTRLKPATKAGKGNLRQDGCCQGQA